MGRIIGPLRPPHPSINLIRWSREMFIGLPKNTFRLFLEDGRGFVEIISNGNTVLIRINDDIDTDLINNLLINFTNQNGKKNYGVYS